jgi:hypothetical protein
MPVIKGHRVVTAVTGLQQELRRQWRHRKFKGITRVYLFVCIERDNLSVDQDVFNHEVSRSHSDTLQSVGLLWTNDQLVAETST